MNIIDNTLKYLRESLANYSDHKLGRQITEKLGTTNYNNESDFVKVLDDEETAYLNNLLEREINYAKSVQHDVRVKELNEVYESLI